MQVIYKNVDLINDLNCCIDFRKDAHFISFGNLDAWSKLSGLNSENYIKYLTKYSNNENHYLMHMWVEDQIIGQLEFKIQDVKNNIGYINLFYLKESYRGTGISNSMHSFVTGILQSCGCIKANLSVSPLNSRAIGFYKKHGWNYVGKSPSDETVDLYELKF